MLYTSHKTPRGHISSLQTYAVWHSTALCWLNMPLLGWLPDNMTTICQVKSPNNIYQKLNKVIRSRNLKQQLLPGGAMQREEQVGGYWKRQRARLPARLQPLDLAALCQGNADRQARLSQYISASLHNTRAYRACRLFCVQNHLTLKPTIEVWSEEPCIITFVWMKDSERWRKGQ